MGLLDAVGQNYDEFVCIYDYFVYIYLYVYHALIVYIIHIYERMFIMLYICIYVRWYTHVIDLTHYTMHLYIYIRL